MNEVEALTILTATPGLGSIKTRVLLKFFGSARETLEATDDQLKQIPGLHSDTLSCWAWWKKSSAWQKNLELAEQYGAKIIPYTDPQYPKRLLELPDHPICLYIKGDLTPADGRSIGVVGTRSPSIYGKEMGEKISKDLAANGFTVVSGLARGIDTVCHSGALQQGRTIAVIGTGLANLYPRENEGLAEMICQNGAVISEFPMMTPPDRQNFPQRNRIVSGMTLGTLLIEAPEKSGAMITMRKAMLQERKLWALPGRADSGNFRGNHSLIKSGKAGLIESAGDIVGEFDELFSINNIQPIIPSARCGLDREEEDLLQKIPEEELNIEEIIGYTKLPIMKINILLMSLVMKKVIKEYPGKIYKKVSTELT